MPHANIWIRRADEERWKAIRNKSEFIHNALNEKNLVSATPREDEIDDPILAEERRSKPELRIKRNDDFDLVYWEKRINNWKVMYP